MLIDTKLSFNVGSNVPPFTFDYDISKYLNGCNVPTPSTDNDHILLTMDEYRDGRVENLIPFTAFDQIEDMVERLDTAAQDAGSEVLFFKESTEKNTPYVILRTKEIKNFIEIAITYHFKQIAETFNNLKFLDNESMKEYEAAKHKLLNHEKIILDDFSRIKFLFVRKDLVDLALSVSDDIFEKGAFDFDQGDYTYSFELRNFGRAHPETFTRMGLYNYVPIYTKIRSITRNNIPKEETSIIRPFTMKEFVEIVEKDDYWITLRKKDKNAIPWKLRVVGIPESDTAPIIFGNKPINLNDLARGYEMRINDEWKPIGTPEYSSGSQEIWNFYN